ncbi:MAG: 3-hydroxyacyl-CoA dehydrogenase NAD-binding domain-containing protein, partial [Proteobacteria bacterium]|nr:3-hydroxyacyl-CoA dehydrogenase NAD-binding domain-containing protein [Pseudomonadota bacterium]
MTVSDQNHLEKYVQDALKDSYNPTNINKAAMDIKIKSIGIIGAGTMGGGIAMNFANIGIPVKLIETNSNHLQKGIEQIHFN